MPPECHGLSRQMTKDDPATVTETTAHAKSCGTGHDAGRCLWCAKPLPTRRGRGSARRFCSPVHRHAFWTAARRWVWRAVESGLPDGGSAQGLSNKRARFPRAIPRGTCTAAARAAMLTSAQRAEIDRSREIAREMCEAAGIDPDATWMVDDPVRGRVECAQRQAWVPMAVAAMEWSARQ